ncbi:flagellar biosynthesis anti-sigma factor FlgM [uncultured Desulfosarcina sp.]|uniref:flagellar biosynthesis anti-sigma factor FlgM n=1 Tax=uncultured Desulfosarcina sp. TaxID=218289 RepID=UPI0029C6A705|nr:flagellar biosynthesis anti-sigma factor FlgM [uncultured Desulfosarcina sp.]
MEIPENGALLPHPAEEISVDGPQQPSQTEGREQNSSQGHTDAVRLTEKGLAFSEAFGKARSLAETRVDRVLELKRQLAQGTYRVMGDRIAVNMIDESLENDSVLKHIDTNV